ncbi:MAG TPA: methyltransferase domain-containing protein [Candidatus Sulfotelmatobacter sp.]|nr:methyltransferase domain-containing protein [Candidatus Sulfotelmatobacter sp.]
MNTVPTIDYIMEDPREAARLEAKVDPQGWVQKYLAHRVRPGAKVLSVGCGPGVILREVSELHPSVHATGMDISADRVREAIQRNRENPRLNFVRGDAQAMQLPSSSFDLVYSRMLLQYLREKEKAVAEMVRVCKPGGVVLLQDLDGQLLWHYPEDTSVQRAVEKVLAALAPTGFDPFVGRKLFWLAQKAGLKKVDAQIESYHLIAGAIEKHILKQWELKLDIAKSQMAKVLGSKAEAEEQIQRFLEYLCRPDTLTYSVQFTVSGEKAG